MISALKRLWASDTDTLDQLAGITGFGWTVSILGYMATMVGYGTVLVTRLVTDPQSLLYLGGTLFVATFGLDHLQKTRSNEEE